MVSVFLIFHLDAKAVKDRAVKAGITPIIIDIKEAGWWNQLTAISSPADIYLEKVENKDQVLLFLEKVRTAQSAVWYYFSLPPFSPEADMDSQDEFIVTSTIDKPHILVNITAREEKGQRKGYIDFVYREDLKGVKSDMGVNSAWLETVYVSEQYRNKGLGSQLLYRAAKFLAEKGITELHLQAASLLPTDRDVTQEEAEEADQKLMKYYAKFGFKRREPMEFNIMWAQIDDITKHFIKR